MTPPPRLGATITALRTTDTRFPWIQPTVEETEVADLLEELANLHTPTRQEPDNPADKRVLHTYGPCIGCGDLWPCIGWATAEALAVQWIGRAADRVYAARRNP